MVWVQRIIWVVLFFFTLAVLYVVFTGGVVDEARLEEHDRREAAERVKAAGEMAYDRYLPGGRQNPGEKRAP